MNCIFKKYISTALILSGTATIASAQAQTHSFWDNTYIEATGGYGVRISATDAKATGWGQQMSPIYGFGVGKWVSPYVALQASYHTGKIKHFSLNYSIVSAQVLLDIQSLTHGYDPARKFHIYPLVGLGAFISKGSTHQHLAVTYGAKAQLDLNNHWGIHGILSGNLTDNDAVHEAMTGVTNIFSLQVGVNYRFGKKSFKTYRSSSPQNEEQIDRLNKEVNNLRQEVTNLNKQLNDLKQTKNQSISDAVHPTTDEGDSLQKTFYTEPTDKKMYIYIRFAEFSSYLSEKERSNIANIGEWMKTQPEFQVKILAFSDNQNDKEYDKELREKRTNAIRKILIDTYKINSSRISITSPEEEGYLNKKDCSAMIIFIPTK